MRITDEHIATWWEQGYVVLDGFLTDEELAAGRQGAARYLPTAEERKAAPERYKGLEEMIEFPFASDELNDLSFHPGLVAMVEKLLGTDEIVLDEALLWGKYAGTTDFDQPIHMDYENNSLVYPRRDSTFGKVVTIIYYTDVTEDTGPTWILPRQHEPDDFVWWPSIRPREMDPRLYEHERPLTMSAGSVLVYDIGVFHRGSTFLADRGMRMSHHCGWRATASSWLIWRGFGHDGAKPEMRQFIQRATPRQRELVGFPAAGHPYWDERTLAGVAARYPEMDMTPYRAALEVGAGAAAQA